MSGIYYSKLSDGSEVGRWSGTSIRKGSVVTKDKQIYLGKVIDKDSLLFYKKSEGFYRFNPETQKMTTIPDSDVPPSAPIPDKRLRTRNVIVTFGGSYFLHELLLGIQYTEVLNKLELKNRDTMYSLLHYYILTDKADREADIWYQNSYVRFVHPRANLASQRISDFYVTFGSDNNRRNFFEGHIPYLRKVTDDEYAIMIDSTGCQNACRVPVTKVSKHNNEVNIEFRMVLVIQRSTGLPVYYELIPGNVIDSSTLNRIFRIMKRYDFNITHISGDAGYSCPANIEKIIFCGSDLLMRLNPAYDLYKEAVCNHQEELTVSTFNMEYDIHYRNRVVRVIKLQMVIGTGMEGEEIQGYVYLCRDMQAYHSKSDHFMNHHTDAGMTAEEILKMCGKFGVFAIVATENLNKEDVIPLYYQRQAIEQFFDYAKNYGKLMPVRNHKMETIHGHMLMSFITTFLMVAIKNKMNILDVPYVSLPVNLKDEEETITVKLDAETQEFIAKQEEMPVVFKSNPEALFNALNFVGADVFENQKDDNNQIIPAIPYKDANDYFKAFGIPCPEALLILQDHTLRPVLKAKDKKTCRKSKVFAKRPFATDEQIQEGKRNQEQNQKSDTAKDKIETNSSDSPTIEVKKAKGSPGRPKGSKNKKTIKREAEMAAQGIDPNKPKRGRGRPFGAKDSKPRKRRKKGDTTASLVN